MSDWIRSGSLVRSSPRDSFAIRVRPARSARPSPTALPNACHSCGVVLDARDRTYCDGCLPEQKDEALAVAADRANAKLARLRAEAKDPAHGGEAARKRGRSNAERIALSHETECIPAEHSLVVFDRRPHERTIQPSEVIQRPEGVEAGIRRRTGF